MKHLLSQCTKAALMGAIAVPAAASVWLVDLSDAQACGGSPPAPNCGVAFNCSIGVGDTYSTGDAVADPDDPSRQIIPAPVDAAFNLVITGNDPRCPAQRGRIKATLSATCQDARDPNSMLPGGALDYTSWDQSTPGGGFVLQNGVNAVEDIPFAFDVSSGSRICNLDTQATVTLTSGQTASASCASQCLSVVDPVAAMNGTPPVSLEMVDTKWVSSAAAGEPQLIKYRVKNNSPTETFVGSMLVASENAAKPVTSTPSNGVSPLIQETCDQLAAPTADPSLDCSTVPPVSVCGCDGKVINQCAARKAGKKVFSTDPADCVAPKPAGVFYVSAPGDKNDNFPIAIQDPGFNDICLALPNDPTQTSPTQVPAKRITLAPGAETIITVIVRTWTTCATCSNNSLNVKLTGTVGADFQAVCGGTPINVDTTVTPEITMCPECADGNCGTPDIEPEPDCKSDNSCPDTDDCQTAGNCPVDSCQATNTCPIVTCEDTATCPISDEGGCEAMGTCDLDPDEDGVPTGDEEINGTDPNDPDTDDDGVPDNLDVAPLHDDIDGDGVLDGDEATQGTNPFIPDTDGDGLWDQIDPNPTSNIDLTADSDGDGVSDAIEIRLGFDPNDASVPANPGEYVDSDNDGLTDSEEAQIGSDPTKADTDGDGVSDVSEYAVYMTDPTLTDTDSDGLSDGAEVNGSPDVNNITRYTNPASADTDSDGLPDGDELMRGADPRLADSDHDGLTDGDEVNFHNTDPLNRDTDNGGALDGAEIENGYDPTQSSDDSSLLDSLYSKPSLVIEANDPARSVTLIRDLARLDAEIVIRKRYAIAQKLTQKIGRIEETFEIDSNTLPADRTFTMSAEFSVRMKDPTSSLSVDRMEMGSKDTPIDQATGAPDTSFFAGEGSIRVTSAPNTVFSVIYNGSVWYESADGQLLRMEISQPSFSIPSMDRLKVDFSVTLPADAGDIDTLYFMSDINGYQRNDAEVACSDGIDNDNDGAVDAADPDCAGSNPGTDGPRSEVCGNGIDDDNNGAIDCADSVCANYHECLAEICDNGIDDDKDGRNDCTDSDCSTSPLCGSGEVDTDPGCGCASSGNPAAPLAPLALLGFGLVAIRRRNKRRS